MGLAVVAGAFALTTYVSLEPIPATLRSAAGHARHMNISDRRGLPLSVSYQNEWNSFDYVPLHVMPEFLQKAFINSEDRHFYTHHGVDWRAKAGALYQNIRARRAQRGASTITEQVVRMLHLRPRNIWSKWLEAWEAFALEGKASKAAILEFYLNEVPYASGRRGVVQAARFYFDRDLSTLNEKEMLALVVLARAPSSFDLYKDAARIDERLQQLAMRLAEKGALDERALQEIKATPLSLAPPQLPVDAAHFVSFVQGAKPAWDGTSALRTTLDGTLQKKVQALLDQRLKNLAYAKVGNAAALVVDHENGEILAWVVAGGGDDDKVARNLTHKINAVLSPRQPGSVLKPFLYAKALDQGWNAATILDDSPMAEAVGSGLHEFRNYNRSFYGKISLREALGNSLNIPALRTIQFVGAENYLNTLHQLGFENLKEEANFYRDGLALGNGEVSLFELAQAYTALAHHGQFRPLRFTLGEEGGAKGQPVYSDEAASLIGNILSDPYARAREFGHASPLNLPVQTAVKTGTSTDYHDAWTAGFDAHYVVAVWMGNLDRRPMEGITGAMGPALAVRSIFAELHRERSTAPLYLSPRLVSQDICADESEEKENCVRRSEYFFVTTLAPKASSAPPAIALTRPTQNLQMAYDPRVPADVQQFEFRVEGLEKPCASGCTVNWQLNDALLATTHEGRYRWQLARGKYTLNVRVEQDGKQLFDSGPVKYVVK